MSNPATGPRFRLAPGVALRGRRLPVPAPPVAPSPARTSAPTEPPRSEVPGFRNTRWDRPALAVSIDPAWLLAPLYARDAAGLAIPGGGPGRVEPAIPRVTGSADNPTADNPSADNPSADNLTADDWLAWWSAALAYRPGTPAPRQADLVSGSPALQRLWATMEGPFQRWLAALPAREPGRDAPARAAERAALAGFAARNGREPGRWTVRILEIPVTGRYLHSPEPRRIVVSAALRTDPDAYGPALATELPRHF